MRITYWDYLAQLPTIPPGPPEPPVYSRFNWAHQYDDVRAAYERAMSDIDTGTESLVQQQFKDEVDINTMVKRFGLTDFSTLPGVLDPRYYGDFSDAPTSFRDALDRVRTAQQRFEQLPAEIKNRFDNDPAKLLDFVQNPENGEEAVRMGLLAKQATPEPPAPPPTTPALEPVSPGT